jgi:hypothetical protein
LKKPLEGSGPVGLFSRTAQAPEGRLE